VPTLDYISGLYFVGYAIMNQRLYYCLFLGFISLLLGPGQSTYAAAPTTRSLEFVENRGQWPQPVRFAADIPGGRLFLQPAGFTYTLYSPQDLSAHNHHDDRSETTTVPPERLRGHAYTVSFVGGRAAATISSQEPTDGMRNYFLGKDSRQWARHVRGFRQLRYEKVYPNTDVQLYENVGGQLEYDFLVAPGGKPDAIRLRYEGQESLTLQEGVLVVRTSVGQVTETAPRAWQNINGRRVPVPCAFVLRGQEVSFSLPQGYQRKYPLVIDPTVIFSSFTGATDDNWGNTATYDEEGHLYSGGTAFGPGYPVSPGAFDQSFNQVIDIAIIKYNTSVNGPGARLYATFLGGKSVETPHSLVVNSKGELLIMGTTSSADFPTSATAFDRKFNGGASITPLSGSNYTQGSDIIVSTLSTDGSQLLASTFLGGNGNDGLNTDKAGDDYLSRNYGDSFRGDIAVDAADNVYLTSNTISTDFPVRNGLGRTYGGGGSDAVVAKLPADLSSLLWSSYLGGRGADAAYSIQLAKDGSVYLAGGTNSTDFPTTTGSYQPGKAGNADGFVAHISADGTSLVQASYLGTAQYDQAYFLQLDELDNVYLLGQTFGAYPVTSGLYNNNKQRGGQFIQKMDPQLATRVYSVVFGSGRNGVDLSLTAFLVDACERIYACGWGGRVNQGYTGGSTDGLPVTSNAIQPTTDGSDFYLIQFGAGAKSVEYATFFGENGGRGEHVDGGTSRFDKRGVVYQAVCGGCGGTSGFPVPPGANTYSSRNNSRNCNNAAFKIDFGLNFAQAGPARIVCADDDAFVLGGSPAGGTWTGPGVTRQADGSYLFTPGPTLVGEQKLTYSVASTGVCITTSILSLTVNPVQTVDFPLAPMLCTNQAAVTLTATPVGGTFSGKGVTGNQFNPVAAGPGTHTITYTLPPGQCGQATRTINVQAPPSVEAGRDTALCSFQNLPYQLLGATPAGGIWSGTGVTPTGMFTPPAAADTAQLIRLTYTYQAENGCSQFDVRRVVMAPLNTQTEPLPLPECPAYPGKTGLAPLTVHFVSPSRYASSYDWDFGDGSPHSTEANPTHIYTTPGSYSVSSNAYYTTNCQVETRYLTVEVGQPMVPNIFTPNNDKRNDTFVQHFTCLPVSLKIFSRWGNEVYSTADYHNDWTGDKLADGIYYFLLRDTDGKQYKGWVEVRR
jgi:gliding motility-associated-like protein